MGQFEHCVNAISTHKTVISKPVSKVFSFVKWNHVSRCCNTGYVRLCAMTVPIRYYMMHVKDAMRGDH